MESPNLANVKIIDADGHVRDRDADIRKFMAEPYCRRQGSLLPNDVWDSSMYGKLGLNITDVPTRLRDMDTEKIDISVLFPTGGFGVTQLPEKDYAAAFCRGYNDWVASICAESPRLKAVGLVPFQDVDAAVVLERGTDDGLPARGGRHRFGGCDGVAARRGDLLRHLVRGSGVDALPRQAAAGIVDDDLRAARCQQQGVLAAQPPASAGHDGHSIVESQFRHSCSEFESVQVALVAPLLQQLVEDVEPRHVVFAEV